MEKPDIHIERQSNGWAIFLHPLGGNDPRGYLYFLDDGRSLLVNEDAPGPTPPIAIRESRTCIPEIDGTASPQEVSEKASPAVVVSTRPRQTP